MEVSSRVPSRRAFLQSSAAAAAGLLGGTAIAAAAENVESKPAWKMRLSCSSINFSSLPIEQAVERIAALGFDAIDIWSAHAGCPHLDDVQKRLGPEGLKELLEKHKLKLYAFSVYSGGYPRYAELLGRAGGGVAVRGSAGPCDPKDLTSAMKQFLEGLKPELELAEKHNSYLAIENHGSALLDSIDSFKAFVDLNRHARLGVALAPYHVQTYRGSVEEAIAVCGDRLLFFYAWQQGQRHGAVARHRADRLPPVDRGVGQDRLPLAGQPVHARRARARGDVQGPGPVVRVSEVLPQGLRGWATPGGTSPTRRPPPNEISLPLCRVCPLYWVAPIHGPFGRNRVLPPTTMGGDSCSAGERTTRKGRRKTSDGRSRSPRRGRGRFELLESRRMLDSGVVFNEIMYHPTGDGASLEWVELHNQLAIDVDVSDWSIRGGIDYVFPEGTFVPGGGYLVVAASPEALAAAGGPADALGPFAGRLANEGERLELVNNSDRLMNVVEYGDAALGRWRRTDRARRWPSSIGTRTASRPKTGPPASSSAARPAASISPTAPSRPNSSPSWRSTRPGPTTSPALTWEPPGAAPPMTTARGRPALRSCTSRAPAFPARRTRR